ncbi:hypothetical protein V6N11_029657 [Hibiscus sabdariffa]|uniref:Uncharacterized protein n=1 Tax=Hibiscus sabdariffa TaxID=183260 RepID=A0ABR2P7F4_9ROSI
MSPSLNISVANSPTGTKHASTPLGAMQIGSRESESISLVPGAERLWRNIEPAIVVRDDRSNVQTYLMMGTSQLGSHSEVERAPPEDPEVTPGLCVADGVAQSRSGEQNATSQLSQGLESDNCLHGDVSGPRDGSNMDVGSVHGEGDTSLAYKTGSK